MARRKPSYPADTNSSSGAVVSVSPPCYENPIVPQFSRWAPELYLPLNGSIADASGKGWTLTQIGSHPADFVTDSPFGSGQSLRVNPDSAGLYASRLEIDSEANATMSLVVGRNFPPWALGFWFKASSLPVDSFWIFQTAVPWDAWGKGVNIINTTGRLQTYQWGTPSFEPNTINLCDGAWHQITILYPRYTTGQITDLDGRIWIDGATAGNAKNAAFNAPPPTPLIKMVAGADTDQAFYLSDFWYTNSTPPKDIATLLWNGGSGSRYSEAGLL